MKITTSSYSSQTFVVLDNPNQSLMFYNAVGLAFLEENVHKVLVIQSQ